MECALYLFGSVFATVAILVGPFWKIIEIDTPLPKIIFFERLLQRIIGLGVICRLARFLGSGVINSRSGPPFHGRWESGQLEF